MEIGGKTSEKSLPLLFNIPWIMLLLIISSVKYQDFLSELIFSCFKSKWKKGVRDWADVFEIFWPIIHKSEDLSEVIFFEYIFRVFDFNDWIG